MTSDDALPKNPKLTVALTFDHDAISWEAAKGSGPVALSRGEYGPRVGLPRVLRLLERHGIYSTFFVPVHTALTFPDGVKAIIGAGHEIACHGWSHENLSRMRPRAQRELLRRCLSALAEIWGRDVRGFRAPFWQVSPRTLEIVEDLGFTYDSSLMADDVVPYRVRRGDKHDPEDRSRLGTPGRLIEVPISSTLDDWPYFEAPSAGGSAAMVPPSHVLDIWTAELRWLHENESSGLMTLTMHPESIGRPSRIAMLETFIQIARDLPDVTFDRLDHAVDVWVAAGSQERVS
jgi:peptidoglycan-N-acetylglucosamine deacetylase